MAKNFFDIFPSGKALLGMLHLAGRSHGEILEIALEEAKIYEEEGLDGAIVEDYHGEEVDVSAALGYLSKNLGKLVLGVNVLSNPYQAFEFAHYFGAKFIQFDTIQTSPTNTNNPKKFNETLYNELRKEYADLCIFGGVRFKYIPLTGRSLKEDIKEGISRCDAIVTTGEGTGLETPIEKLKDFRKIQGEFPLIVGAGVNEGNIKEQMNICDGAIIGSYFKNYNTEQKVQRERVKRLVGIIKG